jgi:hypothetical protein
MADYRQIHTSIWDDDWFCQLSITEKVVFVWLFSNRRAAVSGIYKFTEFICSRETGIPLEDVNNAITRLVDDKKVYIEEGWIWVKNLRKYNDSKSPNSYKSIAKDLAQLPDNGLKSAYLAYYKQTASPLQAPCKPLQGDADGLLEQEQEQEQEQEKEKSAQPDDGFEAMKKTVETLVGYPAAQRDIAPIYEFIKRGVTEEDIKSALVFLDGKKKIMGAADIKGSVLTAVGIRTQKTSRANVENPYREL